MKIIDYLIIYLIIVAPILLYSQWETEDTNVHNKLNKEYDEYFNTATQDSANYLRVNATPGYESGYISPKYTRVNKELAYETYIESLALNFQTEDDNTKDVMGRYVPVYSVVEYDGFSMSVYEKYTGSNGTLWERVWLPKIPFSHSDSMGNILQFTMDDHVKVYDKGLNEWIEGYRKEVMKESSMAILKKQKDFEQLRRNVIVKVLQEHLAYQVNKHNVYTKGLGITYTFAMPMIPEEDWYNTIEDIGVFSFFQGYPYQRAEGFYNQYAFAGSKVAKREQYYATVVNGKKVFYSGECDFNYPKSEIYQTKRDAVKAGYYELSCLNK